jgi:hypothetical protein
MARDDLIEMRTTRLSGAFGHYVRVYDERVPFTGEQLAAHRECIRLRREAGSVRAAVDDERFEEALLRTLRAWGIGIRASRLVPARDFTAALHAALPRLEDLEQFVIDGALPSDIVDRLWSVVSSLGIVQNSAKIVAGTKALHHLLPDLIVPMDRAWTGAFFRFHLPEWQDPASQRRIFGLAYAQFAQIARQVQLGQYVTGLGWRTSRTKVIDNAVIGFCKAELASASARDGKPPYGITVDVAGYPPAKNEALSMLGAGHSHAPRVRLLLEAADRACQSQSFTPVDGGPVSLEVVLRCPTGQNLADATNYLGGIADVLEEKSRRGPLNHLNALAAVWLYRNDRQIKQVTYREEESPHVGYTVTIRPLNTP